MPYGVPTNRREKMAGGHYSIFVTRRSFSHFCLATVVSQNLGGRGENTKIIVSGPLGQTTCKPTENFCGVAESLIHAADVCSWFPGLFHFVRHHITEPGSALIFLLEKFIAKYRLAFTTVCGIISLGSFFPTRLGILLGGKS